MKNIIIAFVCGIVFTALLSVSQSEAKSRRTGPINVNYVIPVRPTSTVYVYGAGNMYKYLKKGYQVQEVIPVGSTAKPEYVGFLMVKYP